MIAPCCGLLEESAAAHERALAIDPTKKTSIAHTILLLGDYPCVFETYIGKGFYLDAAPWAAMDQALGYTFCAAGTATA